MSIVGSVKIFILNYFHSFALADKARRCVPPLNKLSQSKIGRIVRNGEPVLIFALLDVNV